MFIFRKSYEKLKSINSYQEEKIRSLTKEVSEKQARLNVGLTIITNLLSDLEKLNKDDEYIKRIQMELVMCLAFLGEQEEYLMTKLNEKIQ